VILVTESDRSSVSGKKPLPLHISHCLTCDLSITAHTSHVVFTRSHGVAISLCMFGHVLSLTRSPSPGLVQFRCSPLATLPLQGTTSTWIFKNIDSTWTQPKLTDARIQEKISILCYKAWRVTFTSACLTISLPADDYGLSLASGWF
jgi:hypothetical protein